MHIEENILIVFLLPMIFMFHDFEEIIFMESWFIRKRNHLQQQLPRFYPQIEKMTQGKTTAGFALSVAMMFLLISACTLVSVLSGNYLLWWSAFLIFSLHLIMHIGQSIVVRGYVPAVVTSILCLPYAIWGFMKMHTFFTLRQSIVITLIGIPIVAAYLAFAHWIGKKFAK